MSIKNRLIYAVGFLLGNLFGILLGIYDRLISLLYRVNRWRDWKVVGYIVTGNGGRAGGTYTLKRMSREKAESHVNAHFGTVVSVQEKECLIFYRSKE